MSSIDPTKLKDYVETEFTNTMLPKLKELIQIPCISPAYDPDWEKSGQLYKAASTIKSFAKDQNIAGLDAILNSEEGKSPLLFITVDATASDSKTVLFYGHYDKQPAGEGWAEGLDPFTPVEKDGYLYGRGSADDCWSIFGVLLMIKALKNFNIPHPKFVIICEGAEESSSVDLPYYIEQYSDLIGDVNLIVALDSGAPEYSRIWLTTALRGVVAFDLNVTTLTKGIHSGKGSGIAPESFMIMRQLLSRIENYNDAYVQLKDFEVEIPDSVKSNAEKTVGLLGEDFMKTLPLLDGVNPLGNVKKFTSDLYLNNTWKPSLAITGIKGIPSMKEAGNVLRPYTTAKVSIRTPPTFPSVKNSKKIILDTLTKNPPFNSTVQVDNFDVSDGVQIKELSESFIYSINTASKYYLSGVSANIFIGASIPFIYIFANYFPDTPFIVTGAAGFDSNAHGPNERLNLDYTKRFICTFSHILSEYQKFL